MTETANLLADFDAIVGPIREEMPTAADQTVAEGLGQAGVLGAQVVGQSYDLRQSDCQSCQRSEDIRCNNCNCTLTCVGPGKG